MTMKFAFCFISISLLSCTKIKAQQPQGKHLTNIAYKCPKDNNFLVCGTNGVENLLFGNECLLNQAGKYAGEFQKTTLKTCFKDCQLNCLNYYDPICMLNPNTNITRTFVNKCELIKDSCNTEIEWQHADHEKCLKTSLTSKLFTTEKQADAKTTKLQKLTTNTCPKTFKPVCAILAGVKSTFINECLVNAENVKTGMDWTISSQGICEEDLTKVLNVKLHTMHKIEKRSSAPLNRYENFENEFELGDNVEYIRVPQNFQTHFIKQDNMETINMDPNNFDVIYKTKPQIHAILNSESIIPENEKQRNEENTKIITNYPNENLNYYPDSNNLILQELLKHLQQTELQKNYMQQAHYIRNFDREYETPSNGFTSLPASVDKQIKDCKIGNTQLCCSFGKHTRTFKDICELNLHNQFSGEDWQVEYNGACKDCNFTCSNNFEPVCVSKNNLKYTLKNECHFNEFICKYGRKNWKIVKHGICDENFEEKFKKIKDEYENFPPGFRFISNNKNEQINSSPKPSITTAQGLFMEYVTNPPQNSTNLIEDSKALDTKQTKENSTLFQTTSHNKTKSVNRRRRKKKNSFGLKETSNNQRLKLTTQKPIAQDNYPSIYGSQGNSVMSALINAFEETTVSSTTNAKSKHRK